MYPSYYSTCVLNTVHVNKLVNLHLNLYLNLLSVLIFNTCITTKIIILTFNLKPISRENCDKKPTINAIANDENGEVLVNL